MLPAAAPAGRNSPATLAVAAAWALAALAPPGRAQVADPDPVVLDPVIVTATRRAERSFDVPAAIDRIDGATIRNGQPQVNLSESLVRCRASSR